MSAETIPLADVLARCSVLPFAICPLSGQIKARGVTIAATYDLRSDNDGTEELANRQLLTHAANCLPELVAALEGLKRKLESFLPPVDCHSELMAARNALARAKEVRA